MRVAATAPLLLRGGSAQSLWRSRLWSLWQVSMSEGADPNNDANIEIWKIKKLIKSLEMARGCAAAHTLASARLETTLTHVAWGGRGCLRGPGVPRRGPGRA